MFDSFVDIRYYRAKMGAESGLVLTNVEQDSCSGPKLGGEPFQLPLPNEEGHQYSSIGGSHPPYLVFG